MVVGANDEWDAHAEHLDASMAHKHRKKKLPTKTEKKH